MAGNEGRIDLRAPKEDIETLKKAAAKDHRSLSSFLMHYGLIAAEHVMWGSTVERAKGG